MDAREPKDIVVQFHAADGSIPPKRTHLMTLLNLQAWSEHALNALNTTATIVGLVTAAVILICLFLVYRSGTELTARALARGGNLKTLPLPSPVSQRDSKKEADSRKAQKAAEAKMSQLESDLAAARRAEKETSSQVSQLETKLKETRRSEEAKTTRLTQVEGELANVRRLEETKASQLSQVEGKLTETQHGDEAKAARMIQLETELANLRRIEEQRLSRLTELEKELGNARQSATQAQATVQRVEAKQGPRSISAAQRAQFLEAVRGLSTGKVIVSAFFENQETHAFGAELLSLLKEAGFDAVEHAPVNFFTTSRPSSGIRIGCQDMMHAPPQFATMRKGLEAMGLDVPNTSIVNAERPDVVEIQITPKQ